MIPSLVVEDIRSALVEYLASTFALSDDDVRAALAEFLTDQGDGIFRGPYLRVRTPFESVADGWQSPLDWLPEGFTPYAHQAQAFERLSTLDNTPAPTLVTTGTGSGKTECFLYPILDHCARARARGEKGIKALLIYPMNALASDQAGRLAELLATEAELAGVSAGMYVGGKGSHSDASAEHLVDKREILRLNPPDILLTNYKMLDLLLQRKGDRELWDENEVNTLRYVVLDEFHTYDGAQGTDVAMLLRRLGRRLGMAIPGAPLGAATPVATSATLASGVGSIDELCEFATKVFGVPIDATAAVGERRESVDDACGETDFYLRVPAVHEVNECTEADEVAALFGTQVKPEGDVPAPPITSPVELGERLLSHTLTRAVLHAAGERPRTWADAVAEIITRVPDWGRVAMTDPEAVELALGRYLWLLSVARREVGGRERPLFNIEVQLWVREVSRVLRTVSLDPQFRWHDSGRPDVVDPDERPALPTIELPAAYCRRCGMSGWMSVQSTLNQTLSIKPSTVYAASRDHSPTVRVLMRTNSQDPDARWFDPASRRLVPPDDEAELPEGAVAVLATPDDDAAKAQRCPACDERDAIRFIGLRVASLTSVSINTLFSSEYLEAEERKLLAFTDSVQDASHRSSFFAGRTHRINLRALMSQTLQDAGGELTLDELGSELVEAATDARSRFELVPPDLMRDKHVTTVWSDEPSAEGLDIFAKRIGFETDLEFGLRSRVGRTLELSGAAAAAVDIGDEVPELVTELLSHQLGDASESIRRHLSVWLRGMLERLRLKGGIVHSLLEPYIADGGSLYLIWGGRPAGLPPFTADQGRPAFATTSSNTGPRANFDSLTALGATPTWWVDWTVRCLSLEPPTARDLNQSLFALLADQTDLVHVRAKGATRSFGLDRAHIVVTDLPDDDQPGGVRCNICGHRHATTDEVFDEFFATPCFRYRCKGHYEPDGSLGANYYRKLYRSGVTRRVVTGEHTGLLEREAREELEAAFKSGTAADAPNVLTATPTLEMGIDIGDLSAVMLTSVPRNPASYVQRVGRAGRASGNALITTFVPTNPHGLYYLSDPDAMIAGDIRPPNCYLDAIDTLTRQYFAYVLDRVADRSIDAPELPPTMINLGSSGLDEGGVLRAIATASRDDPTVVDGFLELFGDHLDADTARQVRDFAQVGLEKLLESTMTDWSDGTRERQARVQRLSGRIDQALAADDSQEAKALAGERAAVQAELGTRRRTDPLTGLGQLGLLPNYTLVDDTATLQATLWSGGDGDGDEFKVDAHEYTRSNSLAVREFAPGNSFYAGGHRHVVDALEVGSVDEPRFEVWRLCPECGYGLREAGADKAAFAQCPRCRGRGLADVGSRRALLPLTRAYASGAEESARVFDEDDDRRQEFYSVITTVDVEHVDAAWKHTGTAFGAELAPQTRIRTINLGYTDRKGDEVPIAGRERHVTGFEVCAHCGGAADARDDRDGQRPERLHQGWCKVRSGNRKKDWRSLHLFHELVTDAVRVVLPVSMFQVDERLASFKGALLLGLRHDFGGDPDHLRITTSDMPNRSGQGRRNFLVLYDSVPGGTGYLARLADPDRMRSILEAAQRTLALCPCQSEGRSACHRCLLGVVERNEYELVRRDVAVALLDELLDDWHTEQVATVAEVDIGRVEESELERRFKVALQSWAARPDLEHVSIRPAPSGHRRFEAFELRIERDDRTLRYRIEEQEGLSAVNALPDFTIHRLDDKARDIAVFLDGYQFHASAENNNIADDARKRANIRSVEGMWVWAMKWDDVEAFDKAMSRDEPGNVARQPLLSGAHRNAAKAAHRAAGGRIDYPTVDQNPVELLLSYLSDPDDDEWEQLALSTVTGAGAGTMRPTDREGVGAFVGDVLAGRGSEVAASDDQSAMAGEFITDRGLSVGLVLRIENLDAGQWTAIATLPDDDSSIADAGHRSRWYDWLQWSNLLQFIRSPGRDAVITAASIADEGDFELTSLAAWLARDAAIDADDLTLDDAMTDELDLLADEDVRIMVERMLRRGAPDFVAGEEVDGIPLEAAWPSARVAIVPDDFDHDLPSSWRVVEVGKVTDEDVAEMLELG